MARKKRLDVNAVLEQERAGFGLQEEQSIYHPEAMRATGRNTEEEISDFFSLGSWS